MHRVVASESVDDVMGTFHAMARAMQDQATTVARMMGQMDRQSEENSTRRGKAEVDLEYLKFSKFGRRIR